MSQAPPLPFELVTRILELLAEDGEESIPSISNCALVCRDWKITSQQLLFAIPGLRLIPGTCAVREQLLLAGPHLRPMVVNLLVTINQEQDGKLGELESIANVLSMLLNVRRLQIWGTEGGDGSFWLNWSSLPAGEAFEKAVFECVSRSCFTEFTLGNFVIALDNEWEIHQLFNKGPSLKSLQLVETGILRDDREPITKPEGLRILPIRLEKLNLVASHSGWFTQLRGTEWPVFLQDFDFSGLKELGILHEEKYLCDLVGRIPSLEKLTILSDRKDTRSTHAVNLSTNSVNLTTITFKFHTTRPALSLLSWVEDTLKTLPPSNHVSNIRFVMFATSHEGKFPVSFLGSFEEDTFMESWQAIGQILSPSTYPELKEVEISTFGSSEGASQEFKWLALSNVAASGLKQAGERSYIVQTFGEEMRKSPPGHLGI